MAPLLGFKTRSSSTLAARTKRRPQAHGDGAQEASGDTRQPVLAQPRQELRLLPASSPRAPARTYHILYRRSEPASILLTVLIT